MIAQEVESIVPEVVQEAQGGYKAVAYSKLIGYLVEAIKELAHWQFDETDRLTAEVETLREENADLQRRLAAIEARLSMGESRVD